MPTLEAGQKFERYRIVRHIGGGSSGESYEAQDTLLPRTVALKLIHPWSRLSDSARRQFFREMRTLSLLSHPYLATTLDYGEVHGQLYIARQYSSSGSLLSDQGRAWYNPPLDIVRAAQFAHQLAQALYHLHAHGHVHGSLTFSNILVLHSPDQDQQPGAAPFLLADTGSAYFVRNAGQPRMAVLPITAAPEQHQRKRVTGASDQYALAVLLYFLLVGRLPFTGTPDEIEQSKLTHTIPALFLLNPNITLEQEEILRRALSVHPQARYPSVMAFTEDLLTSLTHSAQASVPTEAAAQSVIENRIGELELLPTALPLTMSPVDGAAPSNALGHSEVEEADQPETSIEHATSQGDPSGESADDAVEGSLQKVLPDHQGEPEPSSVRETTMGTEREQPQPQPLPQTIPDVPLPQPQPEPIPQSEPDPIRLPEPTPQPDPEVLPKPAPDIALPVPIPTPPPIEEPAPPPMDPPAKDTGPLSPHQEIPPMRVASLTITSPSIKDLRQIILERERTTLGRAGSSTIFLNQDEISRHHAVLLRQGDRYLLSDERSAQGTMVNGQPLTGDQAYELQDGDCIKIGEYILVFHLKALQGPAQPSSHQVFYLFP